MANFGKSSKVNLVLGSCREKSSWFAWFALKAELIEVLHVCYKIILVHFLTVLCETITRDDQFLRILGKVSHESLTVAIFLELFALLRYSARNGTELMIDTLNRSRLSLPRLLILPNISCFSKHSDF